MKITPIRTFQLGNQFPVESGITGHFPMSIQDGFILFRVTDAIGQQVYGFLARTFPESYEKIRPHEQVIPEKLTTKKKDLQSGVVIRKPVCLLYRSDESIINHLFAGFEEGKLISHIQQDENLYEYVVYDRADWAHQLIVLIGGLGKMVIADGHHRTAAYFTNREEKGRDPGLFSAILPLDQVKVHSYHRKIKVNDSQSRELEVLLTTHYVVMDTPLDDAFGLHDSPDAEVDYILVHNQGKWRKLQPRNDDSIRPGSADLLMHFEENVLEPFCSLNEMETYDQVDFISGTELELKDLDAASGDLLFLFPPVSREYLWDASIRGEIMPPKSTWIEPRMPEGIIQVPNSI